MFIFIETVLESCWLNFMITVEAATRTVLLIEYLGHSSISFTPFDINEIILKTVY